MWTTVKQKWSWMIQRVQQWAPVKALQNYLRDWRHQGPHPGSTASP